ncbi:uncharacterized protein isoform X3 [Rhodnius prolixus]|uniref:uncharacterized protein isoform X3 n=1 Tax=Rhodnius prolixus TaxID=13249 RepID=UPI003D18AB54
MATVVLQYWAPSVLFKRRILYLKEGVPCRIGRCHKNEFAFTNNALFKTSYPHISHYHAFLVFAKDKFFLQDSSSNGTFVNGNLVGKLSSCQIFSEDIVKLGKDYHFDGEFQCFCFKITLTVGDVDFRYSKLIEEEYPNSLHLYSKPPTTEDMSLSVLYDKTLERFEVLQIFDSYGDIDLNKCTEFKYIINRIKEKGFINFYHYITRNLTSQEDEYNHLLMDNITHYVLCIGFSKRAELQKWFIKQESKLLFVKWQYLNDLEKIEVLTACNIPYKKLDITEKQKLFHRYSSFIDQSRDVFKIHFTEISKIIHNKNHLILDGFVFVPLEVLIAAIINIFRKKVQERLTIINKNLCKILYEKRIISIIKYIEKILLPTNNKSTGVKRIVKHNMVDKLAEESFPLCMNILNYYLNKNHHLRNGGRFQYGLFLKGSGMPLSDALIFWRNHFTKKMDVKHFEKQYSYHIRHLYGAVGKMFSYPPHDCNTILKVMAGPVEYHGCPFKLLNKENIFFELKRNQISDTDKGKDTNLRGVPLDSCVSCTSKQLEW